MIRCKGRFVSGKRTMRPEDSEGAVNTGTISGEDGNSHPLASPAPSDEALIHKAKDKKICVSPAVLAAASKHEEDLFQSLRTAPGGLTQSEAEGRTRRNGPNEVAPERPQSWVMRLLK